MAGGLRGARPQADRSEPAAWASAVASRCREVMKRLFLLRHAKSSWDDAELADHDRPLAPRGRRAAKVMARHLRRERLTPELVLCSSSRRTRETFECIAVGVGDVAEVLVERGLYGATQDDLLNRLRAVPDAVRSVMLIGHNPAVQHLSFVLARPGPELERVRAKFPTAALATLEFDGGWGALAPGRARLVAFVTPSELE
jgi:phosphohistidine phosphatase